jgi:hypothetical protein
MTDVVRVGWSAERDWPGAPNRACCMDKNLTGYVSDWIRCCGRDHVQSDTGTTGQFASNSISRLPGRQTLNATQTVSKN